MSDHPELTQKAAANMEEIFFLKREAAQLLDLVVAEWKSDPMSAQCFDLRIVNRANYVISRLKHLDILFSDPS